MQGIRGRYLAVYVLWNLAGEHSDTGSVCGDCTSMMRDPPGMPQSGVRYFFNLYHGFGLWLLFSWFSCLTLENTVCVHQSSCLRSHVQY